MVETLQKKIPTIKPNSKIKILWDFFIMLFILLKFFLIPIELCFGIKLHVNVDPAFGLVNFITSCFFIIDIFLKMNTGFYENGNVVLIKFKILKHYFKSYFILDMLASVHSGKYIYEYIYITAHDSVPSSAPWLHIFFFFKLIELMHVVSNLEESIYMSETVEAVFELAKLMVKIIFYSHLEACLWHAVAYFNKYSEQNWIEYARLTDAYWFDRYLVSLFWSVSALITASYGERVTPKNSLEITVGVFLLFFGAIVFGYTIKKVGVVLDRLHKSKRIFKEKLCTLNRFMKQKKIDYELQDRARKYLHFFLRDRESENAKRVEEILDKFSFSLKEEIYLNTNGVILKKFPILSENFSSEFLRKLVFLMNQVTFIPEEVIFQENDRDNNNLYLITDGVVQIYRENPKKISILKNLPAGYSFGEKEFFTGSNRNYCAKSVSFSSGFSINKEDFIEALLKFPEDYEKFCMIKDEILIYNNTSSMKQRCFSCNIMGHDFTQCRKIRYIPYRDFVISRSQFSKPQERTGEFKRKSKEKFNSRKNNPLVKNQVLDFQTTISQIFSESSLSSIGNDDDFEEDIEAPEINKNNDEQEIALVESPSQIDHEAEGRDRGIKLEDRSDFENISDFSIPTERAVNLDAIKRKDREPKILDNLILHSSAPPNSKRGNFKALIREESERPNRLEEEKKNKTMKQENSEKASRRASFGLFPQAFKIPNFDSKNSNVNNKERRLSRLGNQPNTASSQTNIDSNDKLFVEANTLKCTVPITNKTCEMQISKNFDKKITATWQRDDTLTDKFSKLKSKGKINRAETLNQVENLFILDFERAKSYTRYFIKNNFENVIKSIHLSEKMARKRRHRTMTIFRNTFKFSRDSHYGEKSRSHKNTEEFSPNSKH